MLRTLTRKVALGVALFVVVLLLVTANAISSILSAIAFSDHLTNHTLSFTRVSGMLLADSSRSVTEAETFARTREPEERDEARASSQNAQAHLRALRQLLDQSQLSPPALAEHNQLLERWQGLLDQNNQHITAVIAAVERNDTAGATAAFAQLEATEEQFDQLEATTVTLLERDAAQALEEMASQNQRRLIAAPLGFGTLGLVAVLTVWLLRRFIVRPIGQLSQAARQATEGDLSRQVAVTSNDEIGDLQRTFNQMLAGLRDHQSALERHNSELQQSMDAQQRLVATVQQLSTPLLPVMDGVVVLPLVGHIDTQRADAITRTLLHGVDQQRARTVILDVTGIAAVDSHVMQLLLRAMRATELLGARVWLVGLTTAMAHTLASQHIDISQVRTYRDLGSALRDELSPDARG